MLIHYGILQLCHQPPKNCIGYASVNNRHDTNKTDKKYQGSYRLTLTVLWGICRASALGLNLLILDNNLNVPI